jgi:hypothetical protein
MRLCTHSCIRCGEGAAVLKHEARYDRFCCTVCGFRFNVPLDEFRNRPRPGKSGVIAGRIEVGRGSRWGSGLV